MDNKFSWLQLSDLHIFENSTDWSLMKQSFEALSKAVHPDFLVFTGDYRHLGYNKSYDSSLRFINDIVQLFGLTKEDVFFVPGNHDVQTYDYRNDFISCIKSSTEDVELYKKFMQHDRADLRNAFSEYDKFIHSFYGAEVSDDRVQKPADVVCIPWKNRINIILVNSALASTGKRDCKEIIDISSLSSLRIDNGLPTIALMHHDINSIAKPYQDRLSKIVEMLKISAILCGDKHKLDRIGISQYNIPNTTVPVIVCGKSSVEPRDRYSDLSVIEYDYKSDGNVYVQVYRYNNKADSFGFVKSGDFYHNVNMPFYFPMRPTKNSPTSAQHSHANGGNDNKPLDNSSVQQKTKKKKSNKRKPRSIWLPDAELASGKQTRFDSYTETKCIAPFLEPDSRFLGVSSVKGIGKTFVLQVKRVKSSKKYLCLPQCSTPSIDNNWATERITFQSYDQIQTKNPYDDLVLLWMNAIRCYVVNNIRDETEAITKVIEDRSKEKRISKEIERFMLSDENRSLGNLVSNIITEPQWNNLLKQYDSAIKSICNRSLAIQRKNNPRSKDIAVFVDKVDQSILQTNAEPPADCVVCPKKDNYSECRSERKDPTYCSAENGCQSKNCCYGCELFASTKANAGLRIYDESNSARIKHVNIWQYLQLALMHAAAFISDETQGRIKVFYTMREEVFNCEGNRLGEQNNKIAGRTQKLKYSINEQEKIFNECIQEQADEYLFDPSYKNTPGKQAYAFVGISKLCHPYCKTKDGTNDSETLFESIFRHSFDRSRDIQRFGEYLTERIDEIRNCPTEHKREEFVKQAIEDLAANLAYCEKQSESTVNPSYYTEKMRYLPNYWSDNTNFENLLSLIDRNLLFEDDMRCICQRINNVSSCPNIGCKNDKCKRHPFTVLFKLGYLGHILRNPNNEYYERQIFLDAGEISYFAEADDLMSASHVAYIIHPALSKSIQRKYNKSFLHFSGFILGKNRPVETEKIKAMLEDRATLSKTEFIEKYYYNRANNSSLVVNNKEIETKIYENINATELKTPENNQLEDENEMNTTSNRKKEVPPPDDNGKNENKGYLRILHLSDLHFKSAAEGTDSEIRNEYISSFLKELEKASLKKIDYLCFTGDIANQGNKKDYADVEPVFRAILKTTKVEPDHVLVCPGNHDQFVDASVSLYPKDQKTANQYLKIENLKNLSNSFTAFTKFCERMNFKKYEIKRGSSSYLFGVRQFADMTVACINTAWLSVGKDGNEYKARPAWVGNAFATAVKNRIPQNSTKPVLTLLHHPYREWAEEECSSFKNSTNVWKKISLFSNYILCGHTHQINSSKEVVNDARVLNGGCLYENSDPTYETSFYLYTIPVDKNMGLHIEKHYIHDGEWIELQYND